MNIIPFIPVQLSGFIFFSVVTKEVLFIVFSEDISEAVNAARSIHPEVMKDCFATFLSSREELNEYQIDVSSIKKVNTSLIYRVIPGVNYFQVSKAKKSFTVVK